MTKAGLEHETRLITCVPLPISRAAPAGSTLLDPSSGDPTPSSGWFWVSGWRSCSRI